MYVDNMLRIQLGNFFHQYYSTFLPYQIFCCVVPSWIYHILEMALQGYCSCQLWPFQSLFWGCYIISQIKIIRSKGDALPGRGGGGYIPDFSRQVICFFSGIMSVSKKYCTLMLDYLHIYASPGGKKFYICDSPMRQVLLMDVQCIYLTFM